MSIPGCPRSSGSLQAVDPIVSAAESSNWPDDAIRLHHVRSLARDDQGRFAWIDDKHPGGVSLPTIDLGRVVLRAADGRTLTHTSTPTSDRVQFGLDDPAQLNSQDHIEVVIDGRTERTFRTRRVPSKPGDDPNSAFWMQLHEANRDWQKHRAATARAWVRIATSSVAANAQGEAATMLNNAAYIYTNDGKFDRVPPLLERARELARSIDDEDGLAACDFSEAQLAGLAGAHLLAIRKYGEALEVARRRGAGRVVRAYVVRKAVSLAHLGRFGEALELLASYPRPPDISSARQATDDVNVAWVRLGAMEAGLLEWDLQSLRAMHENAFAVFEAREDSAVSLHQLARVVALDLMAGDLDRASPGLRILEARADELPGLARPFVELLYARAEIASKAFEHAAKRLRSIIREGRDEDVCRAHELMAEIAEARNHPDDALRHLQDATACVDALDEKLNTANAHALFQYSKRGFRAKLANALVRANRPAEAFFAVDRERAAVLERNLQALDVDRASLRWFSYQTARVAAEKAEYAGCETYRPGASRAACRSNLRKLQHEANERLAAFQSANVARPAITRGAKWLARIRSALGERRALLVVVGHERPALQLLVTSKGVLAETTSDPLATWSNQIRNLEHLYVIPDWHPGSYDPFREDDASHHPLAATLSISFLPHANVLLVGTEAAEGSPVVVADSDGTLPRSLTEGKWVAERLKARLIAGRDATRTAFVDALGDAEVLHFVGHADGIAGDPWSVLLRLSRGERLSVFDFLVEGHRDEVVRRPSLVVLNGCATGPSLRAGGGGFPAAMVNAGVTTVLATVAVQSDGAATQFIQDFYDADGHREPAVAFRTAVQRSELRGDDGWRVFRLWGAGPKESHLADRGRRAEIESARESNSPRPPNRKPPSVLKTEPRTSRERAPTGVPSTPSMR